LVANEAAAAPPSWLRQAATSSPAAGQKASAIVLLDEVEATVAADGKLRTVRRYAVRVRDRAAREAAMMREPYVTGSGKVRSIRGWILRDGGDAKDLDDDDVADVAMVNNDVYNEVRVKVLAAGDQLADGDVFGAEVESEDRVLFSQLEWHLQERWPVRTVRRRLTLPAGWRASSQTFNAPALTATTSGTSWLWETRDLPEIHFEEGMPPLSDLVPRLAVSFFGRAGEPSPGQFESWQDVSNWLHAISTPAAAVPPTVTQRARELTASAATELEKIASIGQYAQRIQYVSIQTGLGRGGGYQPRPPALVLERNYGDCKDKASLVRAMLGAIGIKAYLVSIFSGDRNYVRPDWPSPQQFNHAIVAISVSPEVEAASVLNHRTLGRLLLFDPTDEDTPVGELPLHEQGSLALIVSAEGGTLERMPASTPQRTWLEGSLTGAIDGRGGLIGRLRQIAHGAWASDARAEFRRLEPGAYRQALQRRLSSAVQGGRLTGFDPVDRPREQQFELTLEISVPQFAQPLGGLLIVKPPFSSGGSLPTLSADRRRSPVVLEFLRIEDTVKLELEGGLHVDEVPQAASFETPFGRYTLSYATSGGNIQARRTLVVHGQVVPPDQYAELKAFFDKIRAADGTPVVLARK
jgi:transglutaminase-like putative cysteine protease